MNKTEGKTCLKGALIEITQREPLFSDISVCGDWCVRFDEEHKSCRDEIIKDLQIKKLNNDKSNL